jgi:hypothetical protein
MGGDLFAVSPRSVYYGGRCLTYLMVMLIIYVANSYMLMLMVILLLFLLLLHA